MSRLASGFLGFFLVLAVFLGGAALAADISLPAPTTQGGIGLFDALWKRSSAAGGDFTLAEVSLADLSTVLWAATGLNRGGTGYTVPMAEGLPPYVDVYVAGPEGVYLYLPKENLLREISAENIRAQIGAQAFVGKAYYVLIFVSNPEELGGLRNRDAAEEFAAVLTGAMTQDVYLAAAALKLGARYIHSMKEPAIVAGLKLPEGHKPLALMLLGN
ncbi:MAG: nitroreductase family protein [Deltaproteobacteria bacterium]|jgi:hypothetical protein|nr:nitroreductase family protein [Deltaproteobacteria bacterium]